MNRVPESWTGPERINNFRDFGGFDTVHGAKVAQRRLLRSAHGHRASEADLAGLRRLGLAMVTDLRRAEERLLQPSAWLGQPGLVIVDSGAPAGGHATALPPHIAALLESRSSAVGMRDFLKRHYGEIPYEPAYVDLFSRYFAALARGGGAMLIHCSAGKDRTGILASLTLHLLGVHRDDILRDYLRTNTMSAIAERLPNVKARLEAQYGPGIDAAALEALLRVEPDYLAQMYQSITARSSSLDAYLADVLGVDALLRARLLAGLLG
ncbi:protein tyrosine/serine phosphatase [Novosphingobium sp. 1529]|uniref:tyrosine-protein phosphatase n=1 Tax=Novosphingobium sp. 1529 TaxID=3156424 RepID=UPI0014940CFB